MSNEFKQLLDLAKELAPKLARFSEVYEEVERVTLPSEELTMEERYQLNVLLRVGEKLDDASYSLNNMLKPVQVSGTLEKNYETGRYEVDGISLSSGYPVEYLSELDKCYIPSRLEHNGDDYYIVALGREEDIDGVRVRIKSNKREHPLSFFLCRNYRITGYRFVQTEFILRIYKVCALYINLVWAVNRVNEKDSMYDEMKKKDKERI
jgi:hypothetical protein